MLAFAVVERAPLLRVLEQVVTVNPDFLEVRLAIRERFTSRIEAGLTAAQGRGGADMALDIRHAAYALGGMVEAVAFACDVLHQPGLDEETVIATRSRLWRHGVTGSR